MPDIKSLSDEELEAIAKGQKLQQLSDGELEKIAGKKEFPQAQEPQNLEENPANFIEQQHPAVSTALRAAIQFGGGDRAAALQKQLGPDYKVTTQKGRIYVRGKGEKDNLAFDPDMSLMEMLKDYHPGHVPEVQKDLIYDNLDMGLQALLGGTGILPGLLGGGAINLAQQGVGNLTGGRRGLDVGEAAVNAGLGATTNAIPMATKAIATRTLPAVGEFLTGMPAQATKTYIEQGGKAVMGGTARGQMTTLQGETQAALDAARRQAGAEMETARRGISSGIDLTQAEDALKARLAEIQKLTAEGGGTPVFKQEADAIKKVLHEHFPPGEIPAKALATFKEAQNELGRVGAEINLLHMDYPHLGQASYPELDYVQRDLMNALADTRLPPVRNVGGDYAWNLMKRLQELNAGYKGMTGAEGIAEKQMIPALRDASENIMTQLEAKSPAFASANRRFGNVARQEEAIQPFLNNPNPRLSSVGGAQREANETQLDLFKEIDAATGSKLQKGTERAYARQEFNKPGLFPKGSPAKATMRAALGVGGTGLIGGALGLDPVSSAMLGLLGAPAVGPAALKAYIDIAQKAAPAVRSAWAPLGSELYEKVKDDGRQ
jgi:hypothetical protein